MNREALSKLRIQRDDEHRPSSGRPRWVGKLIGAFLLALVLVAGGFAWVRMKSSSEDSGWLNVPDAIRNRTEVSVVRPRLETGRSGDATVVATGYLESRRQAKIGARAPGRIEVVHVEEGSRVSKDQVLAILEHADLDASLAATRAMHSRSIAELAEQEVAIERTKRNFDRVVRLMESRSKSQAEYDQARFEHQGAIARRDSLKAAVELAAARVSEAEQLRENMFIRAPFDGTVISKDAEVGESIMPGGMGEASGRGSVVTIADLQNLEVECDVKEDYIGRVQSGQTAVVAVDAVPDRRYQGRVRKVVPMGDRARATIKVQVQVLDADERLFPEMSSTVYFLPEDLDDNLDESVQRLFCPLRAVVTEGSESYVWRVNDADRLEMVSVTLGDKRDGNVVILSGLDGSETIVSPVLEPYRTGQLVKVVE